MSKIKGIEKKSYPIVISKEGERFYHVRIPDFDIETQGYDIKDAVEMAKDVMALMMVDLLEDGKEIPEPNSKEVSYDDSDIVMFVDINYSGCENK